MGDLIYTALMIGVGFFFGWIFGIDWGHQQLIEDRAHYECLSKEGKWEHPDRKCFLPVQSK